MFSVSRTPVSDEWLSLPSMPARNEASKKTAMDSRLSKVSINSELYPELLSWSAIIDLTQRTSTLPQPIPSDVLYEEEEEKEEEEDEEEDSATIHEHILAVSLSQIFDPTTLAIGFDLSCFDGVDDRFIYAPKEVFLDCCWSDLLGPPSPEIIREAQPEPYRVPTPESHNSGSKRQSILEWSSDESGSDTEECATTRGSVDDGTVDLGDALQMHLNSPYPLADLPPYESLYWNHDTMQPDIPSICDSQDIQDIPQSTTPDPVGYWDLPTPKRRELDDSVGYFPMPTQQPKKLPRRLASLLQFSRRPSMS